MGFFLLAFILHVFKNKGDLVFRKFRRKAPVSDSSLIKSQALRTATLLKRDLEKQVFSREFSELFKSTYFVEDL